MYLRRSMSYIGHCGLGRTRSQCHDAIYLPLPVRRYLHLLETLVVGFTLLLRIKSSSPNRHTGSYSTSTRLFASSLAARLSMRASPHAPTSFTLHAHITCPTPEHQHLPIPDSFNQSRQRVSQKDDPSFPLSQL